MTTYRYLFTDTANTTLAAGITASSPSLQVLSGGGALFPAINLPNEAFLITLFKNGAPTITEVVLVTGRSGDNLTGLQRDFGGTGALAWSAGDNVAIVPTAEALNYFMQVLDLQTQATNYALDVGSATAFSVVLTPRLNGHQIGMPIRWKAGHTNTGPATFNDGVGAAPLVTPDGLALPEAVITAGGIYIAIWDGTKFQLYGHRISFLQLAEDILPSQVPLSAVTQYEADLSIAPGQLSALLSGAALVANIALGGNPTTTTQAANDSSTKLATTKFVNPGVTVNGNGTAIKLASGHILQFGLCNPNGGTITQTFPIPFVTEVDCVIPGSVSSGATQSFIKAGTVSLTDFQIANSGGQSYWAAIGK